MATRRRPALRHLALTLTGALLLVGCGLVVGLEDRSLIRGALDGGVVADGPAAEGAPGSEDAGGPTWCTANPHALCEDFDNHAVSAPWTLIPRSGRSAFIPDAPSRPDALELNTSVQLGPLLSAGFPGTGSPHIACGLKLKRFSASSPRYATVLSVTSSDDSREVTIRLKDDGTLYLTSSGPTADGGVTESIVKIGDVQPNVWFDASFELTRDTATGRQSARTLGNAQERTALFDTVDLPKPYKNVAFTLAINASPPPGGGKWSIAIDELYCDLLAP